MLSELPSLAVGNGLSDIDLDHGQIGFLVSADHLGIVQHSRRIIQQLHADAVGFFDYVAVGDNVALGIDDDARSQRMLANGTAALLAAEEFVEEVVEGILVIGLVGIPTRVPAMRILLDGRFGIDVDHARLQLLGDLRELARELLRRRDTQRGGVRALLFLALNAL